MEQAIISKMDQLSEEFKQLGQKFDTCRITTKRIITDEERCLARLCGRDHIVNKELVVMRDDPANLYGDRCKRAKLDGVDFCALHEHNQIHGVWNSHYSGRMQKILDGDTAVPVSTARPATKRKTSSSSTKATKATKKAKECLIQDEEDMAPAPVLPTPADDIEEEEEEEDISLSKTTIVEGTKYYVWDTTRKGIPVSILYSYHQNPDMIEEVGIYDFNRSKWLSKTV